MINQTSSQYDSVISQCKKIFLLKSADYGTSWRVLRISSLADQINIKAQRIRNIEESGVNKIGEDIESEFMGVLNYCVIGLIQLEQEGNSDLDFDIVELEQMYNHQIKLTKSLMELKNQDYGEVWREMLVSTFTDMLLMRVIRIKQIALANGVTKASEGIASNFMDMINYCVFALIQLNEKNNKA